MPSDKNIPGDLPRYRGASAWSAADRQTGLLLGAVSPIEELGRERQDQWQLDWDQLNSGPCHGEDQTFSPKPPVQNQLNQNPGESNVPPVKPDLTGFPLTVDWQAFTEGSEQRPCRAVQNRTEVAEGPINFFPETSNGGGIHPWRNSDQPLLHHGMRVGDFTFDTKGFYSIMLELTPNPAHLRAWLEVQVEVCARWERARQGRLPVDGKSGIIVIPRNCSKAQPVPTGVYNAVAGDQTETSDFPKRRSHMNQQHREHHRPVLAPPRPPEPPKDPKPEPPAETPPSRC